MKTALTCSLVALNLFISNLAYAANITNLDMYNDAPCAKELDGIVNKTVGRYMTEREMDFDGLEFVIKSIDFDKPYRVVYELEFNNESGWVDISKRCRSFNVDFQFLQLEDQTIN